MQYFTGTVLVDNSKMKIVKITGIHAGDFGDGYEANYVGTEIDASIGPIRNYSHEISETDFNTVLEYYAKRFSESTAHATVLHNAIKSNTNLSDISIGNFAVSFGGELVKITSEERNFWYYDIVGSDKNSYRSKSSGDIKPANTENLNIAMTRNVKEATQEREKITGLRDYVTTERPDVKLDPDTIRQIKTTALAFGKITSEKKPVKPEQIYDESFPTVRTTRNPKPVKLK